MAAVNHCQQDSVAELIDFAKLAKQAERYEDMSNAMTRCFELKRVLSGGDGEGVDFSVEERTLFSASWKHVLSSLRSSFRQLSTIQQRTRYTIDRAREALCAGRSERGWEVKSLSEIICGHLQLEREERHFALTSLYLRAISSKLDEACQRVERTLVLISCPLSGSAGEIEDFASHQLPPNSRDLERAETRVFFLKIRGNFLRYRAEIADSGEEERQILSAAAMRCYRTAQMLAEQTLKSYHPLRLDLAVNYSCFMYEILNQPSEACRIAKEAFDAAIESIDEMDEAGYREVAFHLQLVLGSQTLWLSDMMPEDQENEE